MKDLVINGVLHAHYEIEGDILFLKIIPNPFLNDIPKENIYKYEELLSQVISLIEKVKITKLAYLNI